MSSSSGNQQIRYRTAKAHRLFASKCRRSDCDPLDELAWIDCDHRKLECARLREDIRNAASDRKLRIGAAKRSELRRDLTLGFAFVAIIADTFLPSLHEKPAILVALIILAGSALRTGGASNRLPRVSGIGAAVEQANARLSDSP